MIFSPSSVLGTDLVYCSWHADVPSGTHHYSSSLLLQKMWSVWCRAGSSIVGVDGVMLREKLVDAASSFLFNVLPDYTSSLHLRLLFNSLFWLVPPPIHGYHAYFLFICTPFSHSPFPDLNILPLHTILFRHGLYLSHQCSLLPFLILLSLIHQLTFYESFYLNSSTFQARFGSSWWQLYLPSSLLPLFMWITFHQRHSSGS